jgi:hypothetical protein
MIASRLVVLVALALIVFIVAPTFAQPQQPPSAIMIRAEGWGGWGAGGPAAVALEAATTVARGRGLRVLAQEQPGVPVLALAVSSETHGATIAGVAIHTVSVTVQATLTRADGDTWRGSAMHSASWVTAPIALGSHAAAQRQAAYAAAASVTEAALGVLLPPVRPVAPRK